jgi:hypothetical protein
MICLQFKVIAGVWFACHCGLVSMAGDSVSSPPVKADAAWAVLTRHSDKRDPKELSKAVLDIVHAGHEEDLDKLLDYMQSEEFDRAFAFPTKRRGSLLSYPFSVLMRQIAQCDTMFAEELLVRYAQSDSVFGEGRRGRPENQARAIVVDDAVGRLHPRTNGTYSFLARQMGAPFRYGAIAPLQSLVRIGDERAAGVIRRKILGASTDFAKAENWDLVWEVIAMGRDRPAMFGLLLSLAVQAPNPGLREKILANLVQRLPNPIDPDDRPSEEFPSYERLPVATRHQLLQLVSAADTKGFSPKSLEQINQLKEILSRHP